MDNIEIVATSYKRMTWLLRSGATCALVGFGSVCEWVLLVIEERWGRGNGGDQPE